jgi:hypothetical protein
MSYPWVMDAATNPLPAAPEHFRLPPSDFEVSLFASRAQHGVRLVRVDVHEAERPADLSSAWFVLVDANHENAAIAAALEDVRPHYAGDWAFSAEAVS